MAEIAVKEVEVPTMIRFDIPLDQEDGTIISWNELLIKNGLKEESEEEEDEILSDESEFDEEGSEEEGGDEVEKEMNSGPPSPSNSSSVIPPGEEANQLMEKSNDALDSVLPSEEENEDDKDGKKRKRTKKEDQVRKEGGGGRMTTVIGRIEMRAKAEATEMKKGKKLKGEDHYDRNDGFIDDSDLIVEESQSTQDQKYGGFYVHKKNDDDDDEEDSTPRKKRARASKPKVTSDKTSAKKTNGNKKTEVKEEEADDFQQTPPQKKQKKNLEEKKAKEEEKKKKEEKEKKQKKDAKKNAKKDGKEGKKKEKGEKKAKKEEKGEKKEKKKKEEKEKKPKEKKEDDSKTNNADEKANMRDNLTTKNPSEKIEKELEALRTVAKSLDLTKAKRFPAALDLPFFNACIAAKERDGGCLDRSVLNLMKEIMEPFTVDKIKNRLSVLLKWNKILSEYPTKWENSKAQMLDLYTKNPKIRPEHFIEQELEKENQELLGNYETLIFDAISVKIDLENSKLKMDAVKGLSYPDFNEKECIFRAADELKVIWGPDFALNDRSNKIIHCFNRIRTKKEQEKKEKSQDKAKKKEESKKNGKEDGDAPKSALSKRRKTAMTPENSLQASDSFQAGEPSQGDENSNMEGMKG
eukprot:TRINITY_DN3542_c0_g2_i1.p1 TRINITY_DN3542_c0_g2~~TRINITY_DN3542_c0_g2_i1.p1  ORF type:complete len:660 (-),score=310.36 TRINITY_DN3542_c0_g2_i1:799-2709(-)